MLAFVAMLVFCYRLIFREEADLLASKGESFAAYLRAVPRLFPSPWPRIAPAGKTAKWLAGFAAESWCWGFALALAAFAATLKMAVFVVILGASVGSSGFPHRRCRKNQTSRCKACRIDPMPTDRIYYDDAFAKVFSAQVLSCEPAFAPDEDTVAAVTKWGVKLDRTAFYPTSGGQPHDVGKLGEAMSSMLWMRGMK